MMEEANKKITAKDILSLLRQKYFNSREWVVASEDHLHEFAPPHKH